MLWLVISDTHLKGEDGLPEEVVKEMSRVEGVIHCGDFVGEGLYRFLSREKPLYAVAGNMDELRLHKLLPSEYVLDCEGVKIGIIHGKGAPHQTVQLARKHFSDIDLVIFGHTHQPLWEVHSRPALLNPGSPTDTIWAPYRSYALLEVSNGTFRVELERLTS